MENLKKYLKKYKSNKFFQVVLYFTGRKIETEYELPDDYILAQKICEELNELLLEVKEGKGRKEKCVHPYALVYRKMDYEKCTKCGKVLCEG